MMNASYFEAEIEDGSGRGNRRTTTKKKNRSCLGRCLIMLVLALFVISSTLLVLVVKLVLDKNDAVEIHSNGKTTPGQKPNILYILADDMGYNDIGYNNPEVKTPFLDKLATQNGRILTQHYMQAVCTPSRHALMTGVYPFKSMMQHFILTADSPHCSPTNQKFLPQKLKTAGYSTHLIGKWHLGFCKRACIPTERGFDTFYGLYGGMGDQYQHKSLPPEAPHHDWRNNDDLDLSVNGTHTTDLITQRAVQLLETRDPSEPFFMYLSHTIPHHPIQAPQEFLDRYAHIEDEERRGVLAMISQMDDSVSKIVNKLKETGLYDNTLIVFASDNGGDVLSHHDNSPYRGGKGSLFEGGSRALSFVHSPLLTNTGNHNGVFHVVDWHNTLLAIAGVEDDPQLDGTDQSAMIMGGQGSTRKEFIYNIDLEMPTLFGQAAVRVGDYKLIWGFEGHNDGWGLETATVAWQYPANLRDLGIDPTNDSYQRPEGLPPYEMTKTERDRNAALVQLRSMNPNDVTSGKVHLFHVTDDPREKTDLAGRPEYEHKVMELKQKILWHIQNEYRKPPRTVSQHWVEQSKAVMEQNAWTTGWCEDLDLDL